MKKVEMLGLRFGRLMVIEFSKRENNITYWKCICDCGNIKIANGMTLRTGDTKSCGCFRNETTQQRTRTHGLSKSTEYVSWSLIIARCFNEKDRNYKNYGGRGITMCDRWRNSFQYFLNDMGMKPSLGHSVERINNDGNYEPSNCKWATRKEQSRNRRTSKFVTAHGKTMVIAEWSENTGIKQSVISDRLKRGWNPELAIAAVNKDTITLFV